MLLGKNFYSKNKLTLFFKGHNFFNRKKNLWQHFSTQKKSSAMFKNLFKSKKYIRKDHVTVHQRSRPCWGASPRPGFCSPARSGSSSEAPFSGPFRRPDRGSSCNNNLTCQSTPRQEPLKKIIAKNESWYPKIWVFRKYNVLKIEKRQNSTIQDFRHNFRLWKFTIPKIQKSLNVGDKIENGWQWKTKWISNSKRNEAIFKKIDFFLPSRWRSRFHLSVGTWSPWLRFRLCPQFGGIAKKLHAGSS